MAGSRCEVAVVRRPGDPDPDPPGGRAAERLREFLEGRFPAGEVPIPEGAAGLPEPPPEEPAAAPAALPAEPPDAEGDDAPGDAEPATPRIPDDL
jgi:hypothetical protein